MSDTHEQLPQTISEVDFGDRRRWVTRYIAQMELAKEYAALDNESQTEIGPGRRAVEKGSDQVRQAATRASKELEADQQFRNLERHGLNQEAVVQMSYELNSNIMAQLDRTSSWVARRNKLDTRNSRVYTQVNRHEQELGQSIRHIEPAWYVRRAIGDSHPAIDTRWTQVRAEIELYRHFSGESRSGVTFGMDSPSEGWLSFIRGQFISNISKIQVAQLMLSRSVDSTAAGFGIQEVLEVCGRPERVAPEEVQVQLDTFPKDSWLYAARQTLKRIQSGRQGLLIDVEKP